MNYDLIFFIIFVIIIYIFFRKNRKKFEVQGKIFALYRTKLGLNLMQKISKYPRWLLHTFGALGIFFGFAGMILIFWTLLQGTLKLIFVKNAQPVLAPVLPGVSIPGLPILSFWHWIISIFIVAVIHEFSHGFVACFHKIKIKSSGFAFLGPIPAAFVEPEEKELKKKSNYAQLSVFAAGAFSNIITGLLFFLILSFILTPSVNSMFEVNGVQIASLEEKYPAFLAGLKVGDNIAEINGIKISNVQEFTDQLKDKKPGDKVVIKTEKGLIYQITLEKNPNNVNRGYMGVTVSSVETVIKESIKSKYGIFLPHLLSWINTLFFWLSAISIGIALFNLLPLGPIDGGRMFYTGLFALFKNEKKVKIMWTFVTYLIIVMIFVNLLPYLIRLFKFIFIPIIGLFG